MVNFREQKEKILEFIEKNYINYLPDEFKIFELTTDFLDFDKFKNNFTVFVDFSQINFRQSNYEDDCEDIEHLALKIYLVHRNNQNEILQSNNLDAAFAFYQMIKDNPSLGIAQKIVIESIYFYKYVEGQKYLVCTEINLSRDIEI
jgi:hypothetical protein